MRSLRNWILCVGMLAALLPMAAAQAAVTNVSPEVGPAGTTFLFYAGGFSPGEQISTWLNSPSGEVVTVKRTEIGAATVGGGASWKWVAPDDIAEGRWQMVVHGKKSGLEQVIPFTIGDPAPSPQRNEAYGVTPAADRAGASFTFFANGFTAAEEVAISVSGPGGALADADAHLKGPASAEGRVDGWWISPENAAAGTWHIYLRGTKSNLNRDIVVTITGNGGAPSASLTVSPEHGTRDVPFHFSAAGFSKDEKLSVWLNSPDGRVISAETIGNAQAGPDGRASWGWQAAADAPLGTWQLVAHGQESGREAVVSFTIDR
ncbi:hypothetical protein F8S13_26175 [Chloroflexia bacterium SDU3-3]|nr:hypothetical protein F8S13_26175 [Chloroflexia bacterium SDU3-3]